MNPEQREHQGNRFSRRTLLSKFVKYTATGLAVLSGGDLGYRHAILPLSDAAYNRERASNELYRRAETIYPTIPTFSLPVGADYTPIDELRKKYPDPIVIGYDKSGKPIQLHFLEGEELVKALEGYSGYEPENLDMPQKLSSAYKNRDGTVGSLKPDGTLWTFRERIIDRPDMYNEALRVLINEANLHKRIDWVNVQMPSLPKYTPDTTRDTLELSLLLPLAVIASRAFIRLVNKEASEAAEQSYRDQKAKETERDRWEPDWERIYRDFEEKARQYQEQRKQAPQDRPVIAIEPASFFQALGIDLVATRQLPPDQRRQRVSEIRKGLALLLKDGDVGVWAQLNSQLDTVDPKFDKKRTTGSPEETRKPQSDNLNNKGTGIADVEDPNKDKKAPDRKRVDVPLSTNQSMGQPASLESTVVAPDKLIDFIKRNGSAICPVGTSDGSGGELVNEPYQFTAEETEVIRLALQIEKEELLQERLRKLSALVQMFERYFLRNLRIPEGHKIKFYSLGCGEDGALDAYAMQLVAKRHNVQIEAICVDDNSANVRHRLDQSVVDESARQWQRMAEGGLVDARAAEFIQAPAQSIDFSKGAESQNPLLVVVRNVSPGAWYRILYRGGLRLFPVMEKLRNSGSDSRLMVTFDSYLGWEGFILERSEREYLERRAARIPERGPLDEAAQILKFNGKTIHLQYLGDEFQENPIPTADDGWNDKYVTVVGYNH